MNDHSGRMYGYCEEHFLLTIHLTYPTIGEYAGGQLSTIVLEKATIAKYRQTRSIMTRHFYVIILLGSLMPYLAHCTPSISKKAGSNTKYLINYLQETRYALHKTLAQVDNELWRKRPDSLSWSIVQISDHILKAELAVYGQLSNGKQTIDSESKPNEANREMDKMIIRLATDRSVKMQSPESILPGDSWETPEEYLKSFDETRDATISFLKGVKFPLRDYSAHFAPMNQPIDGYQWILVIAAHTQRHIGQIEELLARLRQEATEGKTTMNKGH